MKGKTNTVKLQETLTEKGTQRVEFSSSIPIASTQTDNSVQSNERDDEFNGKYRKFGCFFLNNQIKTQ